MMDNDFDVYHDEYYDYEAPNENPGADQAQQAAEEELKKLFSKRDEEVFYSRQIEVKFEDTYFHWITNRALSALVQLGVIRSERRQLKSGYQIKIMWNTKYRYYKRAAKRIVSLVEEYSDPNIGAALGLQGEMLTLEAFARSRFVMEGRNTNSYGGKKWKKTKHNIDFIFQRDSLAYGVEVKNMLGYMEREEFETKMEMCQMLKLRPVFVVRMVPRSWIYELQKVGGFALVLKYQLYPVTHKELANRLKKELGLPVGAPKVLEEGTMERFMKWHRKNV